MELEGLKRCLHSLRDSNVDVTHLTTDRHIMVKSHMKKEEPDINHWFDVWHVAKGVYKKLVSLAKKKGCEQIGDWAHSISNHLYWAASTSDGDLVVQKWESITNHVCDKHEGHGDRFPTYQHTYYVTELVDEAFSLREAFPTYEQARKMKRENCPPLPATRANRVDVTEAVISHKSRFNKRLTPSHTSSPLDT